MLAGPKTKKGKHRPKETHLQHGKKVLRGATIAWLSVTNKVTSAPIGAWKCNFPVF